MVVQHNSELRYQGIVDRCLASESIRHFIAFRVLVCRIRVRELDHNRRGCNGICQFRSEAFVKRWIF